jgi:hypothetical protein
VRFRRKHFRLGPLNRKWQFPKLCERPREFIWEVFSFVFPKSLGRFLGSFDLQQWTRIGAMNRSGVSVERRILAGIGMAALCRGAAMLRYTV